MSSARMRSCSFTYDHLRETLQAAIDAGYAFESFADALTPRAGPRLLLRHDVDHSPAAALKLAELEHDLGIPATYFILLSGEYNAIGPALDSIRRIVDLGHWIGVHYDPVFYGQNGLPYPETVHRDAWVLRERLGAEVLAAARHNPVVAGLDGQSLTPLVDSYDPTIRERFRYLSDSCQYWREGCFCRAIASEEPQDLQVLIHGEWWSEDGATADVILDRIRAERVAAVQAADDETRRLFASLDHLPTRDLFLGRPE